MSLNIKEFWKQIRNPKSEKVLDVTEWISNSTSATLGLAVALGVVNPTLPLVLAGLAFTSPFRKIADIIIKYRTKNEINLNEIVAIAAPLAYLKSYQYWIENNSILREKLSSIQTSIDEVSNFMNGLILSDDLAGRAIHDFCTSDLAKAFNSILREQLLKHNLDNIEANITVTWVAWKAREYLKEAIKDIRDSRHINIDNLGQVNIYLLADSTVDNNSCDDIQIYLNQQIATAPKTKVFNERFNLEDIYVPLKISPVDLQEGIRSDTQIKEIQEWAKSLLLDSKKGKQVMFIQADPGRGKSAFCQIFSDLVRKNFHPFWVPILIKLRDIESFDNSLGNTLSTAINRQFATKGNWLTSDNYRFLFILDGFDELRLEGRSKGGLERLINQIASFQERCNISINHHRFIVTGRQLALQGINFLPENLERVKILPMDENSQQQWLTKWEAVIDDNPTIAKQKVESFKTFLRSPDLHREVKEELAKEPLLLYLLASLHRDGNIDINQLSGDNKIRNKISIYDRAFDCVLTQQRTVQLQQEIVGLKIEYLKQISRETGLATIQARGESARIITIENRLAKSRPQIAEKIREFKNSGNQKVLNNALTAFYLKSNYDEDARVEFLHASFGEFMCAKRIYQSFEEWIKWDDINDFYNVKNEQFNTELYDLFGFGILNQEIIEYLFGLIANEDYQLPKHLFVRLEKFYQNWCDGKFINADGTTLSQQFMRQLKEDLPKGSICLGQNQVEIFTGLNVLVILLELHRTYHKKNAAVDIDFHPCGRIESQKNTNQLGEDYQDTTGLHDSNRLLRIIALSHCIDINGFTKTIGANLSGANLSGANLSGANLSGANLSGANLSGASLRQANLNDANLTGANLSDADMCRCDLTGSNLEKAILKNTYLRGADCRNVNFINATLNGTDLCRAYIHNADFECAELADISIKNTNLFAANFKDTNFSSLVWNSSTIWLHAKGIHQVKNIPNSLQDNLDFQDANELSEAYASLDSGEISNAIKICKQVTDRVVQRLRDPSFKAHTYNRFAWLCSLQNPKNQCRGEIISLAREAVKINPKSGTYKDTLALTIIFHPPFYMPLGYGQVEEGANDEEARKNAYEEAIKLLEAALECEDFKKLALPNMNKIRQRRKDWIKSLQSRINPFFSKQEISLLLKEEY